MTDVLSQQGTGSTDWNGGRAKAGGTHTGTSTIVMQDGKTFTVAHSKAEVLRKLDPHAVAQTNPQWVAFDVPNAAIPVVLNTGLVALVR